MSNNETISKSQSKEELNDSLRNDIIRIFFQYSVNGLSSDEILKQVQSIHQGLSKNPTQK